MTNFSKSGITGWWGLMLLILMVVSFISYHLYGPYFSPDSVNYFHYATNFFRDHPWSNIYSPFYPYLLYVLQLLPCLPLFTAAHLLVVVQYVLGLFLLYQLSANIALIQNFNSLGRFTLTLIFSISYHAWWSFRIIGWAHAESTFYLLLICWFYFLTLHYLRRSIISLLVFSIVGALLVWTKNNGLVLVPFLFILSLWDKSKIKWWIPLGSVTASYLTYFLLYPQNILVTNIGNPPSHHLFSMASLGLLGNNLGELFKSSLGFFVSDVTASLLPHSMALLGGVTMIIFLTLVAIAEVRKGVTFPSYFYLFGYIYLFSHLLFQQATFFEEINYRTLYPFMVPCSWFLWMKWISLMNQRWIPLLMMGFVMTIHTVAGHLLLWNRENVNSLFEVGRLEKSGLFEAVQAIRKENPSPQIHYISDQPEKLGLLLNDPHVRPWNSDHIFIQGKRRTLDKTEKSHNLTQHMDDLVQAKGVVVLFSSDVFFLRQVREKGLLILKYPEGLILIHPTISPIDMSKKPPPSPGF